MRPAAEVRQALCAAAQAAHACGGLTLRDLAARACVGLEPARRTVDNMTRAGVLRKVGERRVAYRNRPVAVYAPALRDDAAAGGDSAGWVDLSAVLRVWGA